MHVLSRTLIDLYDAAEDVAPNEYPAVVMAVMHRLISFDGALLGCGLDAMEHARIFHRSPLLPSDYAKVYRSDPLACRLRLGLRVPVTCECRRFYVARECAEVKRFYQRHRIARVLLFGDPPAGRLPRRWVALYRGVDAGFTRNERARMEEVWPHVSRGLTANRRRHLERHVARRAGAASALMNRSGMLEAQDTDFRALLAADRLDVADGVMPERVRQCWRAGSTYVGEHLQISLQECGEFIVCTAVPLGCAVKLTPAERIVANLFASGLNHRQISERLGVSQNTARSHIAHAYAKLDVHDKAALANTLALDPSRVKTGRTE
ncbi:LuxR family transcriptional regulator [Oxalobacteraceae bacterium OM1]|nr:LuxR family transcriptional regulator [Oxalobacteraceae bacterium OM1]